MNPTQPFEFLGYEAVEGEKFLGIATIRAWGKIILKYKVAPGKDGHGFFCSEASIKNGTDLSTGKDNFEKCWMLESNYENELLKKFLRSHVNPYETVKPQQPSFFQPASALTNSLPPTPSGHVNMSVAGTSGGQAKAEDDFPF